MDDIGCDVASGAKGGGGGGGGGCRNQLGGKELDTGAECGDLGTSPPLCVTGEPGTGL